MDEVARVVSTAFTLSNDLRRDTQVTVLFSAEPPPRARKIELDGARLRFLNPDERSTAALLKNALVRSISLDRPVEASPGLRVAPSDPIAELRDAASAPGAFWLEEGGLPLREWRGGADGFTAILGDPTDPTEAEREVLLQSGIPRISVGPRSLRASQCVDVVQNEFDLRAAPGGSA